MLLLNRITIYVILCILSPSLEQLYLDRSLFFFLGEHPPDATEAFQLLPRRHLSLHHNGKDSLPTETGAVEQTPVVWS